MWKKSDTSITISIFFIGCHRVSIFIILAFIFLCYFKIKLYSYCAKSKMFVVMVDINILDGWFPFIIVFVWHGWMTQHIIFNVLWIFHCFWFALRLAISVSSSSNSSIAFGKRTVVADFISFSGTCGFIIFLDFMFVFAFLLFCLANNTLFIHLHLPRYRFHIILIYSCSIVYH